MATKVYDSPTTNLFALLSEEHTIEPQNKQKAKTAATPNRGPGTELTPKERAEAKAQQDAVKKAKKDEEQAAAKAKAEAEEKRRQARELLDDSGFTSQRHQRIKEVREKEHKIAEEYKAKKAARQAEESVASGNETWSTSPAKTYKDGGKPKTAWKGEGNYQKPKDGNNKPKDAGAWKNKGGEGKPKGDGAWKNNKGGEGKPRVEGGKPPKREFEKHSQSGVPRKPVAVKGGHGKSNWDDEVPTGLTTTVTEALTSPALAAPDTDAWGETVTPAAESTAAEGTDAAAKADDAKDKDKDDKEKEPETFGYDAYLLIQEQKKKALEEKLGLSSLKPRELTEDEKKALTKFTLVENEKAKVAAPAPKPATSAPPAAVTSPTLGARKGEKPVALDQMFVVRVAGGRRPKYENQKDNAPRNHPKKRQHIPALSHTRAFPELGANAPDRK